MIRFGKVLAIVLALGVGFSVSVTHAGTKKKTAKASKTESRKPASASKGFKVKISGDFTRVIDEEKGIICYFAKKGGGSCVNQRR